MFINIHVNIFKCYHALRSLLIFIAGAQACAIVFSTVDRDSFEAVEKWKSKVCCSTWNYMYVLHAREILSGFSFVIIVANFTRMTMSVIKTAINMGPQMKSDPHGCECNLVQMRKEA